MVTFFNRPTRIIGVVATLLPDDKLVLDGCVLHRAGDTVVLEHRFGVDSVSALGAQPIEADVPVALVVQGRGVLHKAVPREESLPPADNEALAVVLPGVEPDDFYVQRHEGHTHTFVSVIRKQGLDSLLLAFRQQKRFVVAAGLGPFDLQTLLPFLGQEWQTANLQAGNYAVAVQAGKILGITPRLREAEAPSQYEIGADQIASPLLPAYGASLRWLLGQSDPVDVASAIIAAEREEWKQKLLFQRRSLVLLGLFLVGLLINFLLFSNLTAENQALTAQSQRFQRELTTLAHLRQSVERQHHFLASAGWLTPTSHSIQADQLAATVPAGLQLTMVTINPVDELAAQRQRAPVFQHNTIAVKGRCQEAHILNSWLQSLNHVAWVKGIHQQNFNYDYTLGVGTFSFLIETTPTL